MDLSGRWTRRLNAALAFAFGGLLVDSGWEAWQESEWFMRLLLLAAPPFLAMAILEALVKSIRISGNEIIYRNSFGRTRILQIRDIDHVVRHAEGNLDVHFNDGMKLPVYTGDVNTKDFYYELNKKLQQSK